MAPKGKRKIVGERDTERRKVFLKRTDKGLSFRDNAFQIINGMMKLNVEHPTLLLDEILHSIFFLGKLYDPDFSPECIMSRDVQMHNDLKASCPQPFDLYSTHLPKRSPFSCVLDMIVHLYGQMNDENEIIKSLQDFISQLKLDKSEGLVSSTICVSQSKIPGSVKYYGVSMSTSGCYPGRIVVAASCLRSWDSYVADAVMTHYPCSTQRVDFDGTIRLPQHVQCQAFNLRLGREKPPCRSCGNLFGLETSESEINEPQHYGNCAEAESLSNLLKGDEKVRKQVQQPSETCTDENRNMVKERVLTELKCLLRELKFNWDNNEKFYDPVLPRF